MTSFRIEELVLEHGGLAAWAKDDPRRRNWPVTYSLNGGDRVYVGETRSAELRLRQHLDAPEKATLRRAYVVVDETFNKSVCQDLESYLIRLFSGDGRFEVVNRNDGIVDAEYYQRDRYRAKFEEIFEEMRRRGLFQRTLPEIRNSDLFKFSPFKALSADQAVAVEAILEGLFDDLEVGGLSTSVVLGGPGTGKTVVGIYLMKLLIDIAQATKTTPDDGDTLFADFFTAGHPELVRDLRVALVVPQQALRNSIRKVFSRTPGLSPSMAVTPFDVGRSEEPFDLLIVDEAHRLSQRANQPSGVLNKAFADINVRLFGDDATTWTQLDWIKQQSRHQILLLDSDQTVRPADLPVTVTANLLREARMTGRLHPLSSQMRVRAGEDYVGYARALLSDRPPSPKSFDQYDFRLFDDLKDMTEVLAEREAEVGLSRLLAGYAWPWVSRKRPDLFDISIDGVERRWNTTDKDWVTSRKAKDEVGSIHTIQGYDVNYAGVIIGRDLRWDIAARKLRFDRSHYFDKKGMENNPQLGLRYTDEDLLIFIRNVYSVLLTRGIYGTYVYVCDEPLREHLRAFIPKALRRL